MSTTEELLRFQARILEMIATGRPLLSILDAIARYVESQAEDARCSISFIDSELRFRPASTPSLPPRYNGAIDGVPVYPYIGPCGLAAYQKKQVISENIETDERWSDGFHALTKDLGLKACWSTPVFDSRGVAIATFALFSLHTGAPDAWHLHLIEVGARLAGIAIERQIREERLRLCAEIISRSAEAIRILDPHGKIIEQNAAHRELFGIPDGVLLGKTSAVIFGNEQFKEIAGTFTTGKYFWKDLEVTIDGEPRTSQLRQLSARLMTTQDGERRRVARELHDSAGQYLAAIQMNLSPLRNSPAIPDSDKSRIQDSLDMAERCNSEIRTISYLLHPPLLDEMGLRSAILSYVEGFAERSGIRVNVDIPDDLRRLPAEVETTLFRVIQQSLANIHRHSESRVAEIRLKEDAERVTVEICDEGRGIPDEKLAEFRSGKQLIGVGIAGMRERIRDMHGEFDIRSGAMGTTVEISLPLTQFVQSAKA
jgi:signal transduction histidine kinase